jgi:hypothetical protein
MNVRRLLPKPGLEELLAAGVLVGGATLVAALDERLWWMWAACGLSAAVALGSWLQMGCRFRRERRQVRAALGKCRFCEYDLTGNVSGVRPEFGAPR